ncbi:MAG TPA: type II toxin-antitoxin system RelE/ParE family toxin [Cyclobacteriaceae bacterium]
MAGRKLILSQKAQNERRSILAYWKQRNQSNTYSKKLDGLLRKAFAGICKYPESGQLEKNGDRSKLVAGYRVVYTIHPTEIHVIAIWDPRQDPSRFDFL